MDMIARETLAWVNYVRGQKLHMAPLDTLPKGQPGNAHNCVVARCWQMQDEKQIRDAHFHGRPMVRLGRIDVCSAVSRIEFQVARYPSDMPRVEFLNIEHPREVALFIKHFDNGDYPQLIDPMYDRGPTKLKGKPVPHGGPVTAQMVEEAYKNFLQQMPPPPLMHIDFGKSPSFKWIETPEAPVTKPLEEEADIST
jgi:hypothetical protein